VNAATDPLFLTPRTARMSQKVAQAFAASNRDVAQTTDPIDEGTPSIPTVPGARPKERALNLGRLPHAKRASQTSVAATPPARHPESHIFLTPRPIHILGEGGITCPGRDRVSPFASSRRRVFPQQSAEGQADRRGTARGVPESACAGRTSVCVGSSSRSEKTTTGRGARFTSPCTPAQTNRSSACPRSA
jgi:hypothetical protein